MDDLTDKVAVVTGAASGIGLATARRFAESGMHVVLADIEEPALNSAVAALNADGLSAIGVATDVSSWAAIEHLAVETVREFGKVNVVHNNAGVVVSGPIEDLTLDDWEWVLGVDLWSVIYGVKAFLPLIKSAGEGHIVNTASTCGLQSTASIAPYNVAKFGVVALTETLRKELDAYDAPISASVLCPGAINTRIVESERNRAEDAQHNASPQEQRFREASSAMLAQGMDPDDVANLVLAGIQANDFWILTHPDWHDVVEQRARLMRESNALFAGFGG
ncbi:MAG: SDR family NAD(P)-dependent oxidoreductase [Pseudomonadaceae bacterium]|nr:SDR family NAD(P)-dependent oxidoreductase [Pseudomonadaceae bacterium]